MKALKVVKASAPKTNKRVKKYSSDARKLILVKRMRFLMTYVDARDRGCAKMFRQ